MFNQKRNQYFQQINDFLKLSLFFQSLYTKMNLIELHFFPFSLVRKRVGFVTDR